MGSILILLFTLFALHILCKLVFRFQLLNLCNASTEVD